MNRTTELQRFISKEALGLEIAPYFNPLVPKAHGYNCRILDVFDTETLRENAKHDPMIPDERIGEIEPVDFVGDASRLDELMKGTPEFGACDYIVSSHNFEHLPNPIRFLRGCLQVLKPGGVVSMAIPDFRACFDHYRVPTRLADWLDAYHEDRTRPTRGSVFDARSNLALYRGTSGVMRPGFDLGTAKPERFVFDHDVSEAYQDYLSDSEEYKDAHCSVTCPEIFHLLLSELTHLGLVDFEIVSISRTNVFEYYVHLRKPAQSLSPKSEGPYTERRRQLIEAARRAMSPTQDAGLLTRILGPRIARHVRKLGTRRLNQDSYLVNIS